MIGDYEIVEYKNQFYPDRTYYCATIENGTTKHNTDFEVIVEWLLDYRLNKAKYDANEALSNKVCEEFMKDVKYKD